MEGVVVEEGAAAAPTVVDPGAEGAAPGRKSAAAAGAPRQSTPIEELKMARPLMKLVVPSRGSMAQTKSAPGGPWLEPSSPRMA